MLFGPKKDGFAKVLTISEFEAEVREGRKDEAPPDDEQQPDFLDLLQISETEAIQNPEATPPQELSHEENKARLLADFFRIRSRAAQLTSKSLLAKEEEELEEILRALKEDDTCEDIASVRGDKDEYFYSTNFMSGNYAMIAVLVEEKNLQKTIAEMVRWNAKTYPSPTPIRYFMNSPYFYKEPQIERALHLIKQSEEYGDIKELMTGNQVKYLYSTRHMSEKYAKALAEAAEYGEYGY